MQHRAKVNTQGGQEIPDAEGNVKLDGVEFRYPSKPDVLILDNVSIEIDNKKKRVVALCGHSGCGKSSIVSMTERFYDPTKGSISFNGVNLKDLEPRWYH